MDELISETLRALKRNGFKTEYAADIEAARSLVLELIPPGSTVGIGDSVSVRQLGVIEELQEGGRFVIDLFSSQISLLTNQGEITRDQRRAIGRIAITSDFFITSTNVLTRSGKLLNTDGYGNRVASMIFGPRNVLIVAGRNKIVDDLESAFRRMKTVVAPQLARIKGKETPCAKTGQCTDCASKDRLCNVTTIIEKAVGYTNMTVLLVNEDLGLGWDVAWSKERIERIYAACDELTLLRPKSL